MLQKNGKLNSAQRAFKYATDSTNAKGYPEAKRYEDAYSTIGLNLTLSLGGFADATVYFAAKNQDQCVDLYDSSAWHFNDSSDNFYFFVSRNQDPPIHVEIAKKAVKNSSQCIIKAFRSSMAKRSACEHVSSLRPILKDTAAEKLSVVAIKCAYRFVWYELSYAYFPAAWWSENTSSARIQENSYDSNCFLLLLRLTEVNRSFTGYPVGIGQ